ncbi:MAG TPA: carboxypeptidase-like regulatory domain-containing protein [Bryobacteraceae bacterium]|jgi:hypothetical protein|nr:carboxypeptidase-like regulatory domain-containing protein [Bryobacteraceae bacterium]
MSAAILLVATASSLFPQASTGTITGTVKDQTGAVVPGAAVSITNKDTGQARTTTANAAGLYSAPTLPAGNYDVKVEMNGFRTQVGQATVTAGNTTTVDMALSLGSATEVVNVEAAAAQVNTDSQAIQGTIARTTIQELPLNGRNFLTLASLEPAMTVGAGQQAQFNALTTVTALGGGGGSLLITVDGGNINDEMEGNASMNFSQEVVQEFQLSTVNFDNATGITAAGSINIVTRSGGNDWHGSAYYYYRDHNTAAYPGLVHNPLDLNPFFQRKNPGGWLSGPIKKDKAFFFFSYEKQDQVQVYSENQDLASLQPLVGNFASPYTLKEITGRVDYQLSPKNTAYIRYTHDGNFAVGPYGAVAQPSNWSTNRNWSDQGTIGLTTTFSATLVNQVRVFYHQWDNNDGPNGPGVDGGRYCPAGCIGVGLPTLTISGSATLGAIGVNDNGPQNRQERSPEISDTFTWQRGAHRLRFGIDEEVMDTRNKGWDACTLSCLGVYSPTTIQSTPVADTPQNLAAYFPNLPTSINSNAALLALPISFASASIYQGVPVGNPTYPGYYQQGDTVNNWRTHPWAADTWKVRPNLTLNAGIGYQLESNLWYTDLPYPQYLAPIFGQSSVGKTAKPDYLNFSPDIGFTWSPFKDNKTVIRGGAGIYWDTQVLYHNFKNGFALGPPGDGRTNLSQSVFTNTFPGIVNFTNLTNGAPTPIPVGTNLVAGALTNLTLAQYEQIYAAQLPVISALFPNKPAILSGPYPVSGIALSKGAIEVYAPSTPTTRSYQTSIGMQRDLGHDMVLTADWARRLFENVLLGEQDYNRSTRYLPVNGIPTISPVIPKCTAAQFLAFDPSIECSNGSITVWDNQGRSVYDGLLMKLQKRFSNRYSLTASYAYQKQLNMAVVNLDNLRAGYGQNLFHQNINVSGTANLWYGIKMSLNQTIHSPTPGTPYVSGDVLGVGVTTTPITELIPKGVVPGLTYGCFNVGCGKAELQAAVTWLNANMAGTTEANGAKFPTLILPPNYQLGLWFFDTDLRLTKEFTLKERYKLDVFSECFNLFNDSNVQLSNLGINTQAASSANQSFTLGQPSSRVLQTFNSGGPRAIQFGMRISF